MYSIPGFLIAFIVFLLAYTIANGTDLAEALLTSPK